MKTSALINKHDYLEYAPELTEVSLRQKTTQELLSTFGATLSRSICRLSDDELNNLENNYRRNKKTTGGVWDLCEVLEERTIRNPDAENPEALIHAILGECCYSSTGRMSHKKLWAMITGNSRWHAQHSPRVIRQALERVTEFCVYYKLPIFSLLVGITHASFIDDQDVIYIFEYCKTLGADFGENPFAFATTQLKQAKKFMNENASTYQEN